MEKGSEKRKVKRGVKRARPKRQKSQIERKPRLPRVSSFYTLSLARAVSSAEPPCSLSPTPLHPFSFSVSSRGGQPGCTGPEPSRGSFAGVIQPQRRFAATYFSCRRVWSCRRRPNSLAPGPEWIQISGNLTVYVRGSPDSRWVNICWLYFPGNQSMGEYGKKWISWNKTVYYISIMWIK